jgi:site-specific DNA-methyltransferase (adenine-specific)
MLQLFKGNSLDVMKSIPDASIDSIITDPPYGTTACKWDSVIPFDLMWEQLNRIIKPNGAIVLFGSEPFSSALRISNIKNYKYDWIWNKSKVGNIFNCKNAPQKDYENICVFSFGNIANGSNLMMCYNPQGLLEINKVRKNKSKGRDGKTIGLRPSRLDNSEYKQKHTNYPRQILKFNNEQGLHPTQKPVALIEYLIKTYTNENETVLDFTMGSGTTGVACKNLDRKFIGIEMDDKYFELAKNRIENHVVIKELF